jgi:hypothetical protein
MQAPERPQHARAKLPHLPLWQGAAYRLVCDTDVIPVRLVLASVLPFPRTHVFEHMDSFDEYAVEETEPGHFSLDTRKITVEFA